MVNRPHAPETPGARRDAIALVLAVGMALALNLIVVGVMVAAHNRGDYQLSENATQILTGWGGGIIGVLGAVFGYGAGVSAQKAATPPPDEPEPDDGSTTTEPGTPVA